MYSRGGHASCTGFKGCQGVPCRIGKNGWAQPAGSHAYGSGEYARPHVEADPTKKSQHQNLRGVRSHSVHTILLMRASATGRRHSSSTIQKITESMQGRTVSPSHRQAIAAGQRRRHARRRTVIAMEALHQELIKTDDSCASEESAAHAAATALRQLRSSSMPHPAISSDEGAADCLAVGRPSVQRSVCLEDMHHEYAARLRSFRVAQKVIRPWIEAFQAEHGRKPSLQDALDSRDAHVAENFKRYQVQKDGLSSEIPSMRDALIGHSKRASHAKSTRQHRGVGYNGNAGPLSAGEATARVQAAMNYRKRHHDSSGAVNTDNASGSCQGSTAGRPQDAAARVLGMQAKMGGSGSGASTRAKAALVKALQYKQSRTALPAHETGPGLRRSAVQLVSVEGKAIGGVDYSDIDACAAAPGESHLIHAGHMPVTSYRNAESLEVCGEAELTRSCEQVNIIEPVQSEQAVCLNGLPADSIIPVDAISSEDHRVSACCLDGSKPMGHNDVGLTDDGREGLHDAVGAGAHLQPVDAACPDLAPTATEVDCNNAVALIKLRGKQAAATSAAEASATAAVLAHSCDDGVLACLKGGSSGLIAAALTAVSQAEQIHVEYGEARQSVMHMLRDGADAYFGGIMLLRLLL
eukprot:jgi/Ulvmu1/7369/UM036_0029.1